MWLMSVFIQNEKVYLYLFTKPVKGNKSRFCSYNKKADAEFQAKTPKNWPPWDLK